MRLDAAPRRALDPDGTAEAISSGRVRWTLVSALAVSFATFQLYTAAFGVMEQTLQRAVHLTFVLALIPLVYPLRRTGPVARCVDALLLALGVATCLHVIFDYERLVRRIAYVDPLSTLDLIAAAALVIVVLEVCRRAVSGMLSVVCLLFLLYGLGGHLLPPEVGHAGLAREELLETFYLSGEGIFGIPLGVSATYIFVFVAFGVLLTQLGLMQLIVDLGMAIAGRSAGGPAKVAIICSAMFGTVSGSGLANAITTGNFTIPLMKRVGYRGDFAGGVEAAASMGGNIMPPVMGAAAFVMADFLGVPYVQVALAALIPAMLYFFGLGAMVHFEALRGGVARLERTSLPDLGRSFLTRGHLLLPIAVLMWLLFSGRSVMFAGVFGLATAVASGLLRPATRLAPAALMDALRRTALTVLPIAAACAAVGIVIGVIVQTGLGVRFAGWVVSLADGNMLATLLLAMVASLLLGLGLPTTPNYIIAASLTAPALVQFGLPSMAAHLFVFYFGILADITPPTAITPFALSSIANSDPNRTCLAAVMIASSGLVIPFVFAYDPIMLDPLLRQPDSTLLGLVQVVGSTMFAIVALSAAFIGWLRTATGLAERVLLFAAAVLMMIPETRSDVIGLAIFAGVAVRQTWRLRRLPGSS